MAWVDICLGVVGLLFGREVPANIDATTPMPLQYARSLIVVGGSKVTAASCQASPGAEESMQVSIHTRVPPGRSYQPEFRFSVTGKHSFVISEQSGNAIPVCLSPVPAIRVERPAGGRESPVPGFFHG